MIRLRELRKEKGLTAEKMANILGISVPYLYDLENGRRRIHGEMLSKIADILETSVDYLLDRTDIRETPMVAESQATYKTTPEDMTLLGKIKNLPDKDRKVVETIVEYMERKDNDEQAATGK